MSTKPEDFLSRMVFLLHDLAEALQAVGISETPICVMQTKDDYLRLQHVLERGARNQMAGFPSSDTTPANVFKICGVAFVPPPSQDPIDAVYKPSKQRG